MKKFLTAQWRDLLMVNYEVDPSLLADRVPLGTTLDLFEGKCFVSLVGFMFLDTRVMDFLIPFHVNFEEVNLRFYVKRETRTEIRRGVVFIKEIVPRGAIAWVARAPARSKVNGPAIQIKVRRWSRRYQASGRSREGNCRPATDLDRSAKDSRSSRLAVMIYGPLSILA